MKNFNILDCTLRDGGYYNNWNFEIPLINNYLQAIALSKIDVAEVGFRFIKKNKPIVLVLNAISPIPEKYIDAYIVCHTLRLLSDIEKYRKLKKFIITPYSSFSKNIKSRINTKKILNFGLQVKNKRFKFEKNYVVLPNSLAITYALGICTSGNAEKIFLAGLDGYSLNNPKNFEVDEVLQSYKLQKASKKICSLTPTNYKVKSIN